MRYGARNGGTGATGALVLILVFERPPRLPHRRRSNLSNLALERPHHDVVDVHVVRLLDGVEDGTADGVRFRDDLAVFGHTDACDRVGDDIGQFRRRHAGIDSDAAHLVAFLTRAFENGTYSELGGGIDGGIHCAVAGPLEKSGA